MPVRPYGSWRSEISPDLVSGGLGRLLGGARFVGGRPCWTEIRTDEGGRTVVCEARDGVVHDLTPAGTNARTRVHEYGGGAVWFHGGTVFYVEFGDSRLYRTDGVREPTPLTPEPEQPHALRYADGVVTPDGRSIYCVRERHQSHDVINELVVLPADGAAEARVVASGHDFFMWPRLDPAGRRLAWVSWDHPNMPWDETELWTAEVREDGTLGEPALVDGGAAVIDPQWSPDGVLHWSSDRTGWWNLYRDGRALTSLEDGEIGFPAWVFGLSHYTFLDDGRIACVVTRNAVETLHLLDPTTHALEPLHEEWTLFSGGSLDADGDSLLAIAGSPLEPLAVRTVDLRTGQHAVVRSSFDGELDPATISVPRSIAFATDDGETAHAFYYPPTNGQDEGPAGERPPLRVICHGGPTAATEPHFSLDVQFFTQRGIGVADVNYRGSTGYGSAYRKLLNGRWGEIDWRDCVSAARYLAEEGETDLGRSWVEGGSAGGYVVLCALTFEPHAFAAGVSYFGVADAEALALETHKFESRYLDSMIGPYPERADLYRERSPVHFVDRLERPLLLLQGLDDKVVLPAQAEAMVEVLDRKGIPYAYLPFEGEGHGFRQQANIRRAYEATLSFVGQLFGFEPADEIEPLELVRSAR